MNSSLRLRLLHATDLPFADSLRAQAGWNQTRADWQRFLALEPQGCFLAEWNGTPAGTATTTVYGMPLAWIGMVLVHPDFRRRGIGRALLERCVAHLRGRDVRCLKLDATSLGKQVYDGLGFQDEWTLTRWEHTGFQSGQPGAPSRVRNWRESDYRMSERLDAQAFGVSRQRLLPALVQQSRCALGRESESGELLGFGLLRPGSQALYLGPVAAFSADAAGALIAALLARGGAGQRILWDIPDGNGVAGEWAKQHGFVQQRSLTRMFLGENTTPGDPQKQFALGGPEIG